MSIGARYAELPKRHSRPRRAARSVRDISVHVENPMLRLDAVPSYK
jgi:hypothetical protein